MKFPKRIILSLRPSAWTRKGVTYVCLALVGVGLLSAGVIALTSRTTNTDSPKEPTTPEYQTVLPPGKTIDQLGGWQRVSPPKAAPTFAYTDTVDGVRVNVSQQQLPEDFMENTSEHIAELAKGFSATTEIELSGTDKLYLGTNAHGPQSAILIKNGLLILIKSEDKIKDSAWKSYAESLK